jgi:TfoX/Sxy family transcriptional regulator of competence genes
MPKITKSKAMPKWRPAPDKLIRTFENAMQSVPEAQVRKTFGYPSAIFNGHMFAGLHQESFILRLSAGDRADLQQRQGAKTFEPMPGRPMQEYVIVPESILKSEKQLIAWLGKALAYAKSLPPKTPKSRGKRVAKP